MYKYVLLSFGYVESQSAAQIIFSRDDYVEGQNEFETEQELLEDFTKDLLAFYKENYGVKPLSKKCCKKNVGKKNVNFCPTCGKNLIDVGKIYKDEFQNFLLDMTSKVCDDWGSDYCTRWTPFGGIMVGVLTAENTVIIDEQAEIKLLSYIKDELVDYVTD